MFYDEIKFDEKGLVPAVVQHYASNKVLMVAYMNRESLEKTVETVENQRVHGFFRLC